MPKEQTFCQSLARMIEHSVRRDRAEFWTLWHRPFAIAPRVPVHFHIGARFGASASLPSRWQPMRHPRKERATQKPLWPAPQRHGLCGAVPVRNATLEL